MENKFFVTTAIDYVNALPHVGTAYEKIGADALARFKRLQGVDTFFLMGVDEHSSNVEKRAMEEGVPAKAYCDRMAAEFEKVWAALNLSYDRFIRTTEGDHKEAVRDIFRRIYERGDIYRSKYRGFYCVSCEAFLKDADLEDGLCPSHKSRPEWIEEENYFFALSRYAERLKAHIGSNTDFIKPPSRRNEVLSFLTGGLDDISVSRSGARWGIRCPFDESQAIYVWFDALINYVSGAGFLKDESSFRKWWPADLHVIGKDIVRFHCLIWPAMLMSAGLELPRSVWAHGFVHLAGEKMSKTRGTALDPVNLSKEFGADALRYFLLREVPFDRDGDFTMERFIERYNSDLANDLGNLCQRTLIIVQKYMGGILPRPVRSAGQPDDIELKNVLLEAVDDYRRHMEELRFNLALESAWSAVISCNRYIDQSEPWRLRKDPQKKDRFSNVIYSLCEGLRILSILIWPFMPSTASAIRKQLGLDPEIKRGAFKELNQFGVLEPGRMIGEVSPLFPKNTQVKGA